MHFLFTVLALSIKLHFSRWQIPLTVEEFLHAEPILAEPPGYHYQFSVLPLLPLDLYKQAAFQGNSDHKYRVKLNLQDLQRNRQTSGQVKLNKNL